MILKPNLLTLVLSNLLFLCIILLLFFIFFNEKGLNSDAIILIIIYVITLIGLYRALWFNYVGVIYDRFSMKFTTYFLTPKFTLKDFPLNEINNLNDLNNDELGKTIEAQIKMYTKDKRLAFVLYKRQVNFEKIRNLINTVSQE